MKFEKLKSLYKKYGHIISPIMVTLWIVAILFGTIFVLNPPPPPVTTYSFYSIPNSELSDYNNISEVSNTFGNVLFHEVKTTPYYVNYTQYNYYTHKNQTTSILIGFNFTYNQTKVLATLNSLVLAYNNDTNSIDIKYITGEMVLLSENASKYQLIQYIANYMYKQMYAINTNIWNTMIQDENHTPYPPHPITFKNGTGTSKLIFVNGKPVSHITLYNSTLDDTLYSYSITNEILIYQLYNIITGYSYYPNPNGDY